jgi:hypothetical protein
VTAFDSVSFYSTFTLQRDNLYYIRTSTCVCKHIQTELTIIGLALTVAAVFYKMDNADKYMLLNLNE